MPMNFSVSVPLSSSTGKNFWLISIVSISASCGTARNARSKLHSTADGHSTRFTTCSRLSSVMRALPPALAAAASTSATMRARRSLGSTSTNAARRAST
ncbi:hypothetical protein G6F59_017280 [Rhizopus arrhizus]|nr:hypothetical protein G6F59_017280 [Rhizopus arrhizus]